MLLSALLLLLLLLLQAGGLGSAAPLRISAGGGVELNGRSPRTPGRGERSHHEGNHRDPHHKERFIVQLTGPLSFDPKCKKQFHRLYNTTRDCTVPAYYRRCARLLTQLAKSPRCVER